MKTIDFKVLGTTNDGKILVDANEVKAQMQDQYDAINALQAERDALLVYAFDAEKWFNKHDPQGYVSPKRAEAQSVLAAHDAELAKKAVMSALRMYGDTDLSNKEIIALAENYAASLSK